MSQAELVGCLLAWPQHPPHSGCARLEQALEGEDAERVSSSTKCDKSLKITPWIRSERRAAERAVRQPAAESS
jgi:hypothetical protein